MPILIEYLIHQGHTLDSLLGMSVKQLDAFAKLAADRTKDKLVQDTGSLRVAYHADKKQYMQFLEELEKNG